MLSNCHLSLSIRTLSAAEPDFYRRNTTADAAQKFLQKVLRVQNSMCGRLLIAGVRTHVWHALYATHWPRIVKRRERCKENKISRSSCTLCCRIEVRTFSSSLELVIECGDIIESFRSFVFQLKVSSRKRERKRSENNREIQWKSINLILSKSLFQREEKKLSRFERTLMMRRVRNVQINTRIEP